MGEFSTWQIVITAIISSGAVGAGWTIFNFVVDRLEKREKRKKEEWAKDVSNATDVKKLELETGKDGHTLLLALVAEYKQQVQDLRQELEEAEDAERLTRPTVMHIYECVRQIKNEMDSLNLMILSDEETNVFARRWGNIKTIMVDLENTLAGQRAQRQEAQELKELQNEHTV